MLLNFFTAFIKYIFDAKDMSHNWRTCAVIKKSGVIKCASYLSVKISEYGKTKVEWLLEKRLRKI